MTQETVAAVAAASGIGTVITVAADVATQLLGVPLPVVLAALTGACGARVFLTPQSFGRAFWTCVFWTVAGACSAQLVLWLASWWTGSTPPAGALAGIALVSAALGQRVAPILWTKGGAALERRLDGLFRNDKGGDRG